MTQESDPLGTRIREARTSRNITQEQLAQAMGRNRSTVVSWERGWTNPSQSELDLLALRLGCPSLSQPGDAGSLHVAARALQERGWTCIPPWTPPSAEKLSEGRWTVIGEWGPMVGGSMMGSTPVEFAAMYYTDVAGAYTTAEEIVRRFNAQAGECGPILAGNLFLVRDFDRMSSDDIVQAWLCVGERIGVMEQQLNDGTFVLDH